MGNISDAQCRRCDTQEATQEQNEKDLMQQAVVSIRQLIEREQIAKARHGPSEPSSSSKAEVPQQVMPGEPFPNWRELLCAAMGARGLPASPATLSGTGTNAEFLNSFLQLWWPHLAEFIKDKILELNESLGEIVPGLHFDETNCDMGQTPPKFVNVETEKGREYDGSDRIRIAMSLEWSAFPTLFLQLRDGSFKAGIDGIQFRGTLFLELLTMLEGPPFFEGMRLYFAKTPMIDFHGAGLISILQKFPNLKRRIIRVIDSALASSLVVPNVIGIPLADDIDAFLMYFPLPEAVLDITVLHADQLQALNTSMLGHGKSSDVIVEVTCGACHYCSPVQKRTVNPIWKDGWTIRVPIFRALENSVMIQVWDRHSSSLMKEDEPLGHFEFIPSKLAAETPCGQRTDKLLDATGRSEQNGTVTYNLTYRQLSSEFGSVNPYWLSVGVLEVEGLTPDTLPPEQQSESKKSFSLRAAKSFAHGVSEIETAVSGHLHSSSAAKAPMFWVRVSCNHVVEHWPVDVQETVKNSVDELTLSPAESAAKHQQLHDEISEKLSILKKYKVSDDDLTRVLGLRPGDIHAGGFVAEERTVHHEPTVQFNEGFRFIVPPGPNNFVKFTLMRKAGRTTSEIGDASIEIKPLIEQGTKKFTSCLRIPHPHQKLMLKVSLYLQYLDTAI
jgi:hypothetical protein